VSLEDCTKCGNSFLTEADDYVITPRDAYALTCVKCYFKKLQAENEKLKAVLIDFRNTKECHQTWINEMRATIDDLINEK